MGASATAATNASWEERVGALAATLSASAAAGAWGEVEELMAAYVLLLRAPPSPPDARLADTYRQAQVLVAELKAAVEQQRMQIAADVRHIGRGRKAVSAYR